MEVSKEIKDGVKDSIGYSECSNKESFIIGAGVAFKRAEDFYNSQIVNLTSKAEMYESAYNNTLKDMKTLTDIITRYSEVE